MYIVYGSSGSKAQRAADEIARAAAVRQVEATVHSIDEIDLHALADDDVLVVGCVAKVDTPFGGRPATEADSWVSNLPDLQGKATAVFCTYSFFPHTFADVTTRTAEVLTGLEQSVADRGGTIVASRAILSRRMTEGASAFVDDIITQLAA